MQAQGGKSEKEREVGKVKKKQSKAVGPITVLFAAPLRAVKRHGRWQVCSLREGASVEGLLR